MFQWCRARILATPRPLQHSPRARPRTSIWPRAKRFPSTRGSQSLAPLSMPRARSFVRPPVCMPSRSTAWLNKTGNCGWRWWRMTNWLRPVSCSTVHSRTFSGFPFLPRQNFLKLSAPVPFSKFLVDSIFFTFINTAFCQKLHFEDYHPVGIRFSICPQYPQVCRKDDK